jgi:hypothetical protein
MPIFEFELARVEDVAPWGELGAQSLSWFALTLGRFQIVLDEQVLFRYTDEIMYHWSASYRDAEYQVAAFARDILGSVAAAVTRLPPRIERLASNWELLTELEKPIDDDSEVVNDLWYAAWRWLGERSPCTSYLVAHPKIQIVRVVEELHIHWDNRERQINGLQVWTARQGVYIMSVEAFLHECRDFAGRLLSAMADRIAGIEAGLMKPQVEVSTNSLQEQHETWRGEFAAYFDQYQPDIPWHEAEFALLAIAARKGICI